jgi:F0F1-type ATP synthase membrane subunit b/b'
MISLDISIVYQIILFVILWLILSKIFFRPYLHLLEERERRTTGAEHDSADLSMRARGFALSTKKKSPRRKAPPTRRKMPSSTKAASSAKRS